MPYGDCTLAAGSMYSLDGLDFIHEDPSMHLWSLRKEGIPPRFMLNKQRISVHGMEFNHTDAVTATRVAQENLALTSQSLNTQPPHIGITYKQSGTTTVLFKGMFCLLYEVWHPAL
jgi:hypothetical protein